MELFKKITFNTLASWVGRVLGSLLGIISVSLIARSLGKHGFGEYSTVLAYLATFQVLADLGLYSLLTKEISQKPEKEKELVSLFFTLRVIVAAGFLLMGILLVPLFPYSGAVKAGVTLAAAGFFFLSLSQIFLGVFQKYFKVYGAAVAEVVGRAAQLGLVALFFVKNGNLVDYLGAMVAGSFIIFLLNLFFTTRIIRFRFLVSFREYKNIIKTTLPIAVSLVFTLLYFRLDTLMLSVLKNQEDVGIYGIAYKVLELAIFFPAAFMGIMLPVLSGYAKDNKERFKKVLRMLTNGLVVVVPPMVVLGYLLAPFIVRVIGGEEFAASAAPLRILFVAIGIIFFGTLYGNSVIALGLQKKAMWAYMAGFLFNLALNFYFIPRYSYMGAAWTTTATELLVTVWLFFVIKKNSVLGTRY